ncbi:MAG: hypothetical protein JST00_34720, partial [Deltaproteobacteria bacterium]|nr:hypothetical protein [Deltaproteobacteria bacterium]
MGVVRQRLSWLPFVFVAASSALGASIALAQTAPKRASVTLVHGERGALDASRLESLVALELGSDASRVQRVTVELASASHADVVVEIGGERRTGGVDLPTTERERAIALFVGEMARGAASATASVSAPEAAASASSSASASAS